MKILIYLCLLIGLSLGGHIYVSDISLDYQNQLENNLEVGEVIKITLPFTFGSVTTEINSLSSSTNLASTTITQSDNLNYLIIIGTQLNAGNWYTLNFSSTTTLDQVAGYYSTPIQLATYSGQSGSVLTNYVLYDYNNACGFLSIAPEPTALASFSVSLSSTENTDPKTVTANKYFEKSYYVYLTVQTARDYEYGATYYFTMNGPFTWTGSVETISKNCTDQDAGCIPIYALIYNRDYNYKITHDDKVLSLTRYQNSSKLAIANTEYLKLKVKVKNPNYVSSTGGITVSLVSNYAKFLYEIKTETGFFQTQSIQMHNYETLFFWGIPSGHQSSNTYCPIRVYLTDAHFVWNKITLQFAPDQGFPESTGYKMTVNVEKASYVNDGSIYTNMTQIGSKDITCTTSTTAKYITCENIGLISANSTKMIKFAYVVHWASPTALDLSDFGKINFYHQDPDGITEKASSITDTFSPSGVGFTKNVKNADYQTGTNPVVDVATDVTNDQTEYTKVFATATEENRRSSIKYQGSTAIDLLILMVTNYAKQCCGLTNPEDWGEDCTSTVNPNCVVGKSQSLIIKILMNKNAFTLSELDDSSVSTDIFKGVQILTGMSGGTAVSFYGADTTTNYDNICASSANTHALCNNNGANYLTLANSATDALYNQWHTKTYFYELHLTCSTSDITNGAICGGFDLSGVTGTYQGYRIKSVTLSTIANPLYPQQNDVDFILCVRYVDAAGTSSNIAIDSSSTSLSSSGVYNVQIINYRTVATAGVAADDTLFKVGILNMYTDTTPQLANDYDRIPTLLRVGGSINTADHSSNNGIAFFFDAGIDVGQTANSVTLDPTQCASPIATSLTCKYFAIKTVNTGTGDKHIDYYPGLNMITMTGSQVGQGEEFNYYIPVKITAGFTSAFIALVDTATNPTIAKIYKILGGQEDSTGHFANPSAATTYYTATAFAPNDIDYTAYTAQTINATTSVAAEVIGNSFHAGCEPQGSATDLQLTATIAGVTDAQNDDSGANSATQFVGAAHFIVHSFVNYWDQATLTWSLTATDNTKPFKGECTKMTISKASSINQYIILCPYEGSFTTGNAISTLSPTLKFSTWSWPDNYGEGAPVGRHLRFLWSGQNGNLASFYQTSVTANQVENCTLGSASGIFSLNTTAKKVNLQVQPKTSLLLKAGELRKSMDIIITLVDSTTADPKITQCSSGISNVKCTVSLDGTKKIFTFTLSNVGSSDVTIPASTISLNYWLFSTSTTDTSSTTFTGKIKSYFYTDAVAKTGSKYPTNVCLKTATWSSTAAEDRSISVGDPSKHSLVRSSRTYFSFVFTANYDVFDNSKFKINLAFLDSPNNGLLDNLRCFLYTKTGAISHDFSTFTTAALSDIQILYKQTETTLDYPTSVGHSQFTFKCDGGQMLDTEPTESSLIKVENYMDNIFIGEGSCSDQSSKYVLKTVSSESSVASITMTRLFDSAGQDSTYKFNVKVQGETTTNTTTNVTTTSIRFLAGSYIYVEFARDLSPRFNRLGIIRCYHESNPTYCNYESERRISILVRTDLNHNNTYGHNFSVVGIQRPISFPNNKEMYFAIVPYLGTFNTMAFHDSSSISDEAPDSLTSAILPVVYYSQDSNIAIRSTYSFTMHIKFPAGFINSDVPLWVDFPEEFDEAMFLGWSPSCQLKNVKINDTDNITNFANSCETNITRRVKITLSTDDENTSNERLYSLIISGIPTYHYEQAYANPPLVWIGNTTDLLSPWYKTNLGYFNGTYNLGKFTFTDSNTKQLLNWNSNIPECYIGTYACKAKVVVNTGVNFQADIETITASGIYSSLFSFNPAALTMSTGINEMEFEIAPKYSTAPGLYQLEWTHDATDYYSPLPPLFVIAYNSQISLTFDPTSYEVPDQGYSLPIILSFKDKMPESDITLTGKAVSDLVNATGTETSRYVSFKSQSQTITYSDQYTSSQLQFVVTGQKVVGTNEPDTPSATLSWTLSGTNMKAYSTPNDVTVTVVDAPQGSPELTLESPDTSNKVGLMSFSAICTQSGNLYYVASQSETDTQIEYSVIQSATEDKFISETEVGTVYSNPSRTVYGFQSAPNEGFTNTVTIDGKLQSETVYYLRMYCLNQVGTPSEAKDITWKQPSNSGKPLIAVFEFQKKDENASNYTSVSLTTAQKKEVACVICKETKTEKNRVFGTDGVACSDIGTVDSSNSTNSTRRRILQTSDNNTEYFVVMPDLFSDSGSLDDVKSTMETTEFQTAVTSSEGLSGITIKSFTCSINSAFPSTPLIQSPSVSPAENSITFTWTGANNTDGFVFAGVVEYSNSTVEPTAIQLKKNSGYSFTAYNKAFYKEDTSVIITVSPTTKCLDYKYYWIATNEDPDTYQYTTGVKSGTTKTIGCPTFGKQLYYSFMILLSFLLVILI